MNWVGAIFAALCCLLGVLASVRQMQMLQLNSYFAVRYLRWYKGAFKASKAILTIASVALSVAIGFAFFNKMQIRSAVSALLFLAIIALSSLHKNKTSINFSSCCRFYKRHYFLDFCGCSLCFGGVARTFSAYCSHYNEAYRKGDFKLLY